MQQDLRTSVPGVRESEVHKSLVICISSTRVNKHAGSFLDNWATNACNDVIGICMQCEIKG